MSESVKAFAAKTGFYTMEPTGDTVTIIPMNKSWQAAVW
jgi:hypothetical protein